MLNRESVIVGIFVGVLIAGVAGSIFQRIQTAQRGMGAPNNPMSVRTSNTPRDVMQAAARATRTCLFWAMILILFVIVSLAILYGLLVVLSS